MALEGTIMRDTTQANLSGRKGVDGAQHAFRHTKPRPGYVPRLRLAFRMRMPCSP